MVDNELLNTRISQEDRTVRTGITQRLPIVIVELLEHTQTFLHSLSGTCQHGKEAEEEECLATDI